MGSDPEPEKRQLGIMAPQGRSAATRAPKNGRVVRTPPGERLRGDRNLLAGEEVIARCPEPLRQPYKSPSCVLWRSDRRPAGGQEGHQSAAVYVVESQPYSYLDLRVDEHPDPGAELRRIYEVAKVELLPFIEALPARKNPKGGFGGRSGAP